MSIFDSYYKKYDSWYDRNEDIFNLELNTVRKFSLKEKGIEIGTGTGRFASALNIEYGIDPSQNMLKIAEKRGIKTVCSKGESIPYEDNFFNYALIIATLCFAGDPQKLLNETYRILKKGGLLVTGILRRDSKWVKYYMNRNSLFYKNAHFYSPEEIIELFENSGFSYKESFQSLFKGPEDAGPVREPDQGYSRGSFVVLGAIK